MSKHKALVQPDGILLNDVILSFKPWDKDARFSRVKVEEIERRRGCSGAHINGNLCVTGEVLVERN